MLSLGQGPKPQMTVTTDGRDTEIIAIKNDWKCDRCSFSSNSFKSENCSACGCNTVIERQKVEPDGRCNEDTHDDQLNGDFQLITDASVTAITNGIINNDNIESIGEPSQANPSERKLSEYIRNEDSGPLHHTPEGATSSDFWVCKHCTLENPSPVLTCLACSMERDDLAVTNTPKRRTKKMWACRKCTLKNSLDTLVCKACETPYSRKSGKHLTAKNISNHF